MGSPLWSKVKNAELTIEAPGLPTPKKLKGNAWLHLIFKGRKVINVRYINCSYNNMAKGIRLLDKKAIFVFTGKSTYK